MSRTQLAAYDIEKLKTVTDATATQRDGVAVVEVTLAEGATADELTETLAGGGWRIKEADADRVYHVIDNEQDRIGTVRTN